MKYPVADAHCDFLYYAAHKNYNYDIKTLKTNQCMTIDRMKKGNVKLQLFAAWTDMKETKRSPLQQFLEMAAAYHKMLDENSDVFIPFSSSFNPNGEKTATMLTIEDLSCMMDNITNLDIFYRLGVRCATLVWNYKNGLASPATDKCDKGLTPLGTDTVKRMVELGIKIDLAHLSDKGIDKVLSITNKPVFSSHTNVRSQYFSPRSLKDEHIKEISRRGGVIGINFYNKQLCSGTATIRNIADHIMALIKIGGIDCVAIGSDFDGMVEYPSDLKNSSDFGNLTDELEQRGLDFEQIQKIMYSNLARYLSIEY